MKTTTTRVAGDTELKTLAASAVRGMRVVLVNGAAYLDGYPVASPRIAKALVKAMGR